MSKRGSRPSSAASRSSVADAEIRLECRAAFLGRYDDIKDEIESKEDLALLLQQTGRNSSRKIVSKYWTKDTESLLFEDFVDVCRREPVTSEDDLMRAFRKIDINGDGYISLDELCRVMSTKGERMSRSEVKAMIDEVDDNKDGRLDYREFSHMVVSSTEDFRKMSIKVMEKKEKRKYKKHDGDITPRRDEMPGSRRSNRPQSASHSGRHQPSNLKDWPSVHSKGAFFVDEEGILSHSYRLDLPDDSDVWITIQPLRIGEAGESLDGTKVDTGLLVLSDDNSFVAFTEHRDSKGKYSVRCSLTMGSYILLPFSTGCRLKLRKGDSSSKEAKLITRDKEGKIGLSRAFKQALDEIFEMSDLDGNGLLSRDEFNWYNERTSGDSVADDEWQVVEDNTQLDHGELTRAGFIRLNEMEAEDNSGETDDLWITLTSMGFNKSLILDEACPFKIKVHTQNCRDPELTVTGLVNNTEKINEAICEFVLAKGESSRVKGMKDLLLYTYQNDHRAIVVVDNKSRTRVKMELDCSQHKGLVSHTGSLVTSVSVPAQTAVVGHHILPLDDGRDFHVVCEETILK